MPNPRHLPLLLSGLLLPLLMTACAHDGATRASIVIGGIRGIRRFRERCIRHRRRVFGTAEPGKHGW